MIDEQELLKVRKSVRKDFNSFEEDEQLKNLLSILLYDEGKTRDTLDLFEILPVEYFVKVIKLLNGRRVRFIDYETLEKVFKTIILYIEIEQEKKSWSEVIQKYPEWNISKNKDKILINEMIRSLQEKAMDIFTEKNL